MARIYLIGYMGSGKSTVGRALAQHLGCAFIDMDAVIEDRLGGSIRDAFERYGEALFRQIEREVLMDTGAIDHMVIATGGGAPTILDNMQIINKLGTSIYLKMTASSLTKRLEGERSKRPLLKDKSREELADFVANHLTSREQHYAKASHHIDGDKGVEEIVGEITSLLSVA